jgi:hypothetical protein
MKTLGGVSVFQLDPNNANLDGTHLVGEVKLPPAFMVKRFGKHDGGDGIRSSGGWTFAGEQGAVFTLYEWRCTTLSNGRGSGSPTVKAFWKLWEPVSLHIGGHTGADWQRFRRWLRGEYKAYRSVAFNSGKLSTQVWRERIMKYEPISMWR